MNFWKIFEVEKYTQILEASLLVVEGHAVFSILAIMHGNMQIDSKIIEIGNKIKILVGAKYTNPK